MEVDPNHQMNQVQVEEEVEEEEEGVEEEEARPRDLLPRDPLMDYQQKPRPRLTTSKMKTRMDQELLPWIFHLVMIMVVVVVVIVIMFISQP